MNANASDATPPAALPFSGAAGERPKKGVLRLRFEAMKNDALDAAMGKGDSWAKKVGYGDQGVKLDDVPKLIAVLGLKLVDRSKVCVTREEHEAYKALARVHLNGLPPPNEDDPE